MKTAVPHAKSKPGQSIFYYVYLIECRDGTFYTGMTPDLRRRLSQHNQGRGAKYTAGRGPVRLRYFEKQRGKSAALRREYALKKSARAVKIQLIQAFDPNKLDSFARKKPAKYA